MFKKNATGAAITTPKPNRAPIFKKKAADATVPEPKSATDAKLQALLGNGRKPSRSRNLLITGGALLAVAVGVGVYLITQNSKQANTEVVYREYTVERGDVVVGLTESSSISLQRETVTFPVSSTVEEIYVKAGSSVKEGDPLVRMNTDEIETSIKSYDLQLEIAGLELERSKLQLETKLLQAKQQLESSKENGSLAKDQKSVTISELQLALTKAETSLNNAREELADYTSMSSTFESDYRRLKSLEDSVAYWQDEVSASKSEASDYSSYLSSAKSELTSAGNSLVAVARELDKTIDPAAALGKGKSETLTSKLVTYYSYYSSMSIADAYLGSFSGTTPEEVKEQLQLVWPSSAPADPTEAQNFANELDKYLYYLNKLDAAAKTVRSYTNKQSNASSDQSSAESRLSDAQSVYDDFKEYYTDKYGTITDAETIAKKIISLEADVETANINLEKAELSAQTGSTDAEQKLESSANEAASAQTNYELTEMELAQAVDSAQEAYNDLLTQIEDAKALINEDGIVYAPCNGMVSSVSVSVGDSVKVTYDTETRAISQYAQLLVMTNISDVYVPVTISEEDILDVSIGQEATVTMNAFSGQSFDAVVDSISVEAARMGAATINYTVTVLFSEANELDMYEGMSAEVTLVQRAARDVLYINSSAVTTADGKSTVLIKGDDGTGVVTEVKTGFSDGRYVEIKEGLEEGDVVLMESAVGMAGTGSSNTSGGSTPNMGGNMIRQTN